MADTQAPGPRQRVWRSVLQVVVGTAVAVPAAIGALQAAGVNVDPAWVAWGGGASAAFVILASAAQNAWEEARGRG